MCAPTYVIAARFIPCPRCFLSVPRTMTECVTSWNKTLLHASGGRITTTLGKTRSSHSDYETWGIRLDNLLWVSEYGGTPKSGKH